MELSFGGIHYRSMGLNGRLVIPADFRKILQAKGLTKFIIARLDKSIVAYTFEEWEKVQETTLLLASKSEQGMGFRESFLDEASACRIDKRGRISIPYKMRANLGFKKIVVFVGLIRHFEILALSVWKKIADEIRNSASSDEKIAGEIQNLASSDELTSFWSIIWQENDIPDILA